MHPSFRHIRQVTAILTMLAVSGAAADHFRNVDGMEIYLGFVPSAILVENVDMHEGFARKEGNYHLTIALFDSNTGKRLENARVEAEVAPAGLENDRFRLLEPMMIGGTVTFGHYFKLPLKTVYRIHIRVTLPNQPKPVTALFEYDRRADA